MVMLKLRECGVYTLPDGRKYVAHQSGRGCYSLFSPLAWKYSDVADYVLSGGRVLSRGVPTRWRAADLRDTGLNAEDAHSFLSGTG